MNRALKQTRIQIMKQFEKKSLEYRVLKYYWKLIKDIKRNAFGYRNFDNFKKRIYIALNCKKARTSFVLARA